MKRGDFYEHYKGTEYFFACIALPVKDENIPRRIKDSMSYVQDARYQEDTHDLKIFESGGAMFIDSEVPHVIYQSEKDYNTDYVYAREVDDFFGYTEDKHGKMVKRFVLNTLR